MDNYINLTKFKFLVKLEYMKCNLCPRKCNIERNTTQGFCASPEQIRIAKYMLHYWEEPFLCNDLNGSGAIFFSGCNLKCVYCQNHEISNGVIGQPYSAKELASLFKKLEDLGALNINLVTPTHYQNQIIEALKIYKPKIPVIWNSSGYEISEEIKKLKDYIDIYLVDLKYMDSNIALKYSGAKDYPEVSIKAILQMKINQPLDIIENGVMKKGVIIRHLVLPNQINNTFLCLDWIKNNLGINQYVSLMAQYTPCHKSINFPEINRKLHNIEYKRVLNYAEKLGFTNIFYQDLESASTSYIPDFKS